MPVQSSRTLLDSEKLYGIFLVIFALFYFYLTWVLPEDGGKIGMKYWMNVCIPIFMHIYFNICQQMYTDIYMHEHIYTLLK